MPRPPPAALIAASILVLAACTSNTTPHPIATQPRDLGPEAFLGDVVGDTADDLEEAGDLAELSDVDNETGRGRACQLLAPDCEDGLKCTPDTAGAASCQPVAANPLTAGQTCGQRGQDDCDVGLLCYAGSDAPGDLTCTAICDPSTAAGCGDGLTCQGPLAWLQTPIGVCAPPPE